MNFFDAEKNNRNAVRFLALLMALSLFANYSYALGGAAKNDVAYLQGSESARFVMLFWGDDEEIELGAEKNGWTIIIEPRRFFVSQETGDEYVSTGSGYARATRVNVFAKPDAPAGGSFVLTARSLKNETGISVSQGLSFVLTVKSDVPEITESVEVVDAGVLNVQSQPVETQKGETETRTPDSVFYFIVIILVVIAVSVIIYKKS